MKEFRHIQIRAHYYFGKVHHAAHRFYIGKLGTGFLYLFTLGLLGVGVIFDLFTLAGQVRQRNTEVKVARLGG